jgi:hypothetical protein
VIDTVASVVFFTLIAAATELFIAGMAWREVLVTRLIMVPVMVLTGRPYGIWRDWCFKITKPAAYWLETLTDCLAFMTFQLPIYAATLAIAGASGEEILTLLLAASGIMLIISRPFGLYLDGVRAWMGVVPATVGKT